MHIHTLAATALFLAAPTFAQGALPLSDRYVFSEIQGEHGSDCGGAPVFNLIGSQTGTVQFFPNGTAALDETEHGACEDGSFFTGSASFTVPYSVGSDGSIAFDPGPEEFHAAIRPDLEVIVGAGDTDAQSPSLLVGSRLSSGLGDSTLSGLYLIVKVALVNDGGGTRGEVWYGTLSSGGSGSYSAQITRKAVDALGVPVVTSTPTSGTYSVASDGKLVIDGMPGGITADGGFFHAADLEGQNAVLLVGVPLSSGATNELLGGRWTLGDFFAEPGGSVDLPEFCSAVIDLDIDSMTAGFAASGTETCWDPTGESVTSFAGTGTYFVFSDGSMSVTDTGAVTSQLGGVDPTGTLAFLTDVNPNSDLGASVFLRLGQLPIPFGSGTPGTGGNEPVLTSSGGFAHLGNPAFAFEVDQALAGAPGFFGLTVMAGAGLPLFGGLIWIDPTTVIALEAITISSAGEATIPFAIPNEPTLDGASVHAQCLVLDPAAPAGFAMTAGLQVPLMR